MKFIDFIDAISDYQCNDKSRQTTQPDPTTWRIWTNKIRQLAHQYPGQSGQFSDRFLGAEPITNEQWVSFSSFETLGL